MIVKSSWNSNTRFIAQSPKPIVKIFNFDSSTGIESKDCIEFSATADDTNVLQGYSFKFSTNDTDGYFSLTLHPGNTEEPFFDNIRPLQIVKIFERDKEAVIPDFVGVINSKKFVAQAGSSPRISIIGKSVASFISRFKINLDLNAMSLTNDLVEQSALDTRLTSMLANENQPLISTVLETIWDCALKMSKEHLQLSNSGMEKYISKYLGNNFFEFENDENILYPLACVFNGQNTIMFWDIVSNIIPFPVYEKFAFINSRGITKIKIRKVPFNCSGDGIGAEWDNLEKTQTALNPALIKSFDLELSDDEVYTAYFSYITGSPIEQDKALRLATQTDGYGANEVSINKEKAEMYGYSPLIVSFNGYGKTEKSYTGAGEKLTNLNKCLQNWYGHLDEMYKGNITMSTDLNSSDVPMCGEMVSFLGGEFYVNEVEHSWNYGGNPETKLTVSRGGDYSHKKFSQLKNITKLTSIFWKLLEVDGGKILCLRR